MKRPSPLKAGRRFIAHVDMDAFFASVEMRDDPDLAHKPVIVGSDPKGGRGRGVVSACSYEARKFGIHSAMPIAEAYRRCPGAVFLPVDIEKYSAVSERIYEIFYSFTPDIEPVGIDEAFLDITGTAHLFGTPVETCKMVKERIRTETGLTASVGLAPSKIAAKIASDLNKPDALVEVPEGGLKAFLKPLEVRRLWGLGPKAESVLKGAGINTIGDMASRPVEHIVSLLGPGSIGFWKIANGIDESALTLERETKSISNEFTFESDTADRSKIAGSVMALSEKVAGRLRAHKLRARTVTLKIRLSDFKTYTRSVTLSEATDITDSLYNAAKELYNEFAGQGIRLVGLKAANFTKAAPERDLFTQEKNRKLEWIDSSVDKIRCRFGDGSIYRASAKKI